MHSTDRAWWEQVTALVTLSVSGGITGFSFVPHAAADLTSPAGMPIHLMALEQSAKAPAASDAMLRSAIVNVAMHFLHRSASKTPAEMEAIIWHHDSVDGVDHGESCAAFASLTLELASRAVGQQSWVTGGTSYPWPLHKWVDARVDPNSSSIGITSVLQDAENHGRWHALGDGYTPKPGDWVLFDEHVEVVTGYTDGVLHTIGGDSLPNFSVNAHSYPDPLPAEGVAGFVNNGDAAGMSRASQGSGGPMATTGHPHAATRGSRTQARSSAGTQAQMTVVERGMTRRSQDRQAAGGFGNREREGSGRASIPGAPATHPRRPSPTRAGDQPSIPGLPSTHAPQRDPRGPAASPESRPAQRRQAPAPQGAQPSQARPPAPQPTARRSAPQQASPATQTPGTHTPATRQDGGAGHPPAAAQPPASRRAAGDQRRPAAGQPSGPGSADIPGLHPAGGHRPAPGAAIPGQGGAGGRTGATRSPAARASGGQHGPAAQPGGPGSADIPGLPSSGGGRAARSGHAAGQPAAYGRHHPTARATPGYDSRAEQAFIHEIAPGAMAAQRRYGVPASVTIAQAIDESAWGRSKLATQDHNLFGIKGDGPAGSDDQPTREWENGQYVTVTTPFRVYHNVTESIDDHGKLLATSRYYRQAMANRGDPNAFAAALTGVYATDPQYGTKLIALMQRYDLYQFDTTPAAQAHSARPHASHPRTPAPARSHDVPPSSHPAATHGPAAPSPAPHSPAPSPTSHTPVPSPGVHSPAPEPHATAPSAGPHQAPRPAAPHSGAAGPVVPHHVAEHAPHPTASQPAASHQAAPHPAASRPTAPRPTPPRQAAPHSPEAYQPSHVLDPRVGAVLPGQHPAGRVAPPASSRAPAAPMPDPRRAPSRQPAAPRSPRTTVRLVSARTPLYQQHIPPSVWTALIGTARAPLLREEPLYRDIAGHCGIRWELLAACDWMQCRARPGYSPVRGEKLGTVNPDGTVYRTKSEALEQCSEDLVNLARTVYRINLTAPGELSVRDLASAFAAFRWGGLLKLHRTSALEFPYSVAGLTAQKTSMRWPDIADSNAPDKPGSRFTKPFGAVPIVLCLNYQATV